MASAEDACSQVIQDIRETCLNFQVQETPYSAFICLRKSFKKGSVTSSQKKAAFSTIKSVSEENLNLSLDLKNSEEENDILKLQISEIKSQLEKK